MLNSRFKAELKETLMALSQQVEALETSHAKTNEFLKAELDHSLKNIGALQARAEDILITSQRIEGKFLGSQLLRMNLQQDDLRRDMFATLADGPVQAPDCWLECKRLVAEDSPDHIYPWGTANDNTRHPAFVNAVARMFDRPIRFLDLGCAGGGLVYEMARAGHQAYGVEGSTFSKEISRAEWGVIPDRLFTGDITHPIEAKTTGGEAAKFDLITAWEVLEHLPEALLDGFFDNLNRLLTDDGMFVASVAVTSDIHPISGVELHAIQQPYDWWEKRFESAGLKCVKSPFETHEYVRGSGNPRAMDWNAKTQPEIGFHIAVQKA